MFLLFSLNQILISFFFNISFFFIYLGMVYETIFNITYINQSIQNEKSAKPPIKSYCNYNKKCIIILRLSTYNVLNRPPVYAYAYYFPYLKYI